MIEDLEMLALLIYDHQEDIEEINYMLDRLEERLDKIQEEQKEIRNLLKK